MFRSRGSWWPQTARPISRTERHRRQPTRSADAGPSLGSAFMVVEYVEGETIPRRILRDDKLAEARAVLAERCGEALAAIHRIPCPLSPGWPVVILWDSRELLDRLDEPHPAFELAFRWLETARPPSSGESVVHGDFRNGNLIVGPEGIRAVLDWELAHLGDPLEDLGWLCVKAWRFGRPCRWEVSDRWSSSPLPISVPAGPEWTRTLFGGGRCSARSGGGSSASSRRSPTHQGRCARWELAAIGRRVCEVEWDLLELLP